MSIGIEKLNNLKAKHNALTREYDELIGKHKELTDEHEHSVVRYNFMKNKTTTCRIVMENQTRLLEEIQRVLDEKLSMPRKLDLITTVVRSKRKRNVNNTKHETLSKKHKTLIEKYNADDGSWEPYAASVQAIDDF